MYRPIVPVSGLQGWQFLKRTMPQQSRVFENSREIQREEKYFRENISKIRSADDLLGDRRLLRVALAAFGLEEEASKTFFLRRILTDDISSTDALANKLLDKRFLELSKAFGFAGNSAGNTARAGFVDSIATKFRTRSFEVAVGDVDNDMRLAMTFAREIGALAQGASESAGWFKILGNPPVREVLQTALGLPKEIASLDLDQQRASLREKAKILTGGGLAALSEPKNVEKIIRHFFVKRQAAQYQAAAGSVAVTLLGSTVSAMANLYRSNFR